MVRRVVLVDARRVLAASGLLPWFPTLVVSSQLLLARSTFLQERQDRLLRHDSVPGVRNHTQLRSGDRSEHLDGVLRGDDVAVSDDDQGGRRISSTVSSAMSW